MGLRIGRREVLTGVAGVLGAVVSPRRAFTQGTKTRLILLGTGGGPRPRTASSASAQVILVNDEAYVIDCGNGVARQLVFAGVPLPRLRHIFLTHHHSDHNADYGNLISLAWAAGLQSRVDTWGPPPLEKMTALFFQMNASDIETRIADESRVPLAPLVHVHEVSEGGAVTQNDRVKVTAAIVNHPPFVLAFAYRFDAADRSIVISGDTAHSPELIALAKGADVLVHETMHLGGLENLLKRVPNAATLREHLLASHTVPEDIGKVAAAAGVKTLVLSHLVPSDDTSITDSMWAEGARKHYSGTIIVGRDLLEIQGG
jgi:ribonuclease BN (tRNA processing enzyme)